MPIVETPNHAAVAGSFEQEAPFDDELEAEPTRIESEMGIEEQAEVPRLVVIGGNDRGKEYPLQDGDNGIGRGLDNVVVLADIAVSRKHTLVCREGGTFVVRDLGSGNGTLVNGQRMHTHQLVDGDQIELGNTLLRFVLPPQALADAATMVGHVDDLAPPPPDPHRGLQTIDVRQLPAEALPSAARRPLTRRQKLLAFGGGGVLLLLLLMLGLKVVLKRKPKPPPTAKVNASAEAAQHFDLGLKYFRAQNWEKARTHYLRVYALAPGFEEAKTYAKRAADEMKARDAVAAAKKALAAKDYDTTRAELAKVTTKSFYEAGARKLKQQCDDEQVAKLIASAQQLKEADDKDGALAKVKEARRIAPTNQVVKQLYDELKGDGTQVAVRTKPHGRRPAHRPGRRPVTHTPKRPRVPSSGRPIRVGGSQVSKALGAYRRKEWGPAYETLNGYADSLSGRKKAKVKKLAQAVKKVGVSYARALRGQVSNPGEALRQYQTALKYDRQIPRSPHQGMLRAAAFKVARIHATTAFSSGNYPGSYAAVKAAQNYGALDGTLQSLLKRLDAKAMELFTKAYTMRTRSPKQARRIWQRVLKMVPSKSPAYQKAYSWLNNSTPRYQDEDED